MKTQIVKIQTVVEFVQSVNNLFENAESVCKMLVQMVEANPKVYDEIVKANPRLTYNFLANLERVGRGQLYFGLLCDSSPGARKLFALPPSQQKAIYENPVRVVTAVDGKHVVTEKPIQQLSRHEANLLIDDSGHVRTVDEQIKFVSAPSPIKTARRAQRYEISGDRLKVMEETEFDIPTLEEILERMKSKSLKGLEGSMKRNQVR
jgi:hypothetical protein